MANERKPDERGSEEVERELEADKQRHEQGRARLVGDMAQDRNLSGSTTWETLADQADPHLQHARKGQAESPNDLTHEEQPKQQHRGGRE